MLCWLKWWVILSQIRLILERRSCCILYGWKSRRSGFRFLWNYWVQRGLFNRDEYLGYFFENDCYSGRFRFLTADRKSKPNSEKCQCARTRKYIYRRRAKLEFVTLNALSGPIYIGKDAEIMEGSVIRGPLHCVKPWWKPLKYTSYTVGPHSRIGGEVNNLFQLIRTKGMMVLETQCLGNGVTLVTVIIRT
jgi:hypothetical protein